MSFAPDTTVTTGGTGVIRTEIKDADSGTSLGVITTTVERDTTSSSQHVLKMTTSFGFYGYDGTATFATDKGVIKAVAQAIAAHFYNANATAGDSVYEYVDSLS